MDEQTFITAVGEILEFYERIGFERFDNPLRPDNWPQEPAEILRKRHRGRMVNLQDPTVDYEMLREFFNEDVWVSDVECDVCEGNDIYAETLYQWAQISLGAFEPMDVHETWVSERGPITISFELDGKNSQLNPKFMGDYLDLEIIESVNKLISKSGMSFQVAGIDQIVTVLCITDKQKDEMIKMRNFPFKERVPQLLDLIRRIPQYLD